MDNKTRYEFLFSAARESLAEGEFSLNRRAYNLSIRRSQEAVELGLSALLALLGIHYPKNHDQAPLVIKMLKSQGVNLENEKKVESISIDLSRKRGPALHQESGYDNNVAIKAIADSKYVLEFVELKKSELLNKYTKQVQ